MVSKFSNANRMSDKNNYLLPIRICASLIFAHLACAKVKGSNFVQYESAKILGRIKNATNE